MRLACASGILPIDSGERHPCAASCFRRRAAPMPNHCTRAQKLTLSGLIPSPLSIGPEHLVVHVDPAIAQQLIELVQRPLPPRVSKVQVSHEYLFAIEARGTRQRPAGVAHDDAVAEERL